MSVTVSQSVGLGKGPIIYKYVSKASAKDTTFSIIYSDEFSFVLYIE